MRAISTSRPSRTTCRCSSSPRRASSVSPCSCSAPPRCSGAASGVVGTSSPWRSSCPRISCTRSSTSTGTSSPSRLSVFLVAGALVGKPAAPAGVAVRGRSPRPARRCSCSALLLLPWLGERWSAEAAVALDPRHAITLAKRARSVDPLLVEPLLTLGFASDLAESPARCAGVLRRGGARAAEEPGHAAPGRPVRAEPRLPAPRLRVSRAVHGARPEGAAGERRRTRTAARCALVNTGKPTC